jgi:uncharacterized membrane protein YdjX (TVP38/TMEM64 family)
MTTKQKKIIRISCIVAFFAAVITLVIVFRRPIFRALELAFTRDEGAIPEFMESLGALGYILIICLMGMFVLTMVIPPEPVMFLAGVSYDWYIGIALCAIGAMISNHIIYLAIRVFKFQPKTARGRKKDAELDERIRTSKRNIWLMLLIMYCLPAMTFGMLAMIAIKSRMKYWQFVLITLIGGLFPIAFAVLIGTLFASNMVISVIFTIGIILIASTSFLFRRRIVSFLFRPQLTPEQKLEKKQAKCRCKEQLANTVPAGDGVPAAPCLCEEPEQ